MSAIVIPAASSPGDPGSPVVKPYSASAVLVVTGGGGPSLFVVGVDATSFLPFNSLDVVFGPLRDFLRQAKSNSGFFAITGLRIIANLIGVFVQGNPGPAAPPVAIFTSLDPNGNTIVNFVLPDPGVMVQAAWAISVRLPHSIDR